MKKVISLLLFPAALLAQGGGHFPPAVTPDEILGQINSLSPGVPFLRIAPDARAGGMGDGSVALSNDANAMFWNPSRLAFHEPDHGIALSYNPWLRALVPDLNHFYAAGYFKPDSVSAIGASFTYFSMGTINVGGGLPIERMNEMSADIAYSRKFRKNFSGGLTGRYFRSNNYPVYNYQSQGFAMDIGLTWVGDRFDLKAWNGHVQSGLAITNIGPKINYVSGSANSDFLPTNVALAFGGEFEKNEKHFFAFQVEVNKLLVPSQPIYAMDSSGNPIWTGNGYLIAAGKDPNRSAWKGMTGSFNDSPYGAEAEFREMTWSAGIEYDYKHIVKGRAGFFYEHALNGNRQYLTFGFGARYQNLAFDVSYLLPVNAQRSPLQNTWKFTLIVNS